MLGWEIFDQVFEEIKTKGDCVTEKLSPTDWQTKYLEEWRSIKMVVLGNGGIGKSTFVHALKQNFQQNSSIMVLAFF